MCPSSLTDVYSLRTRRFLCWARSLISRPSLMTWKPWPLTPTSFLLLVNRWGHFFIFIHPPVLLLCCARINIFICLTFYFVTILGDPGPEGLWLRMVVSNASFISQHHYVQKVKHVQVRSLRPVMWLWPNMQIRLSVCQRPFGFPVSIILCALVKYKIGKNNQIKQHTVTSLHC